MISLRFHYETEKLLCIPLKIVYDWLSSLEAGIDVLYFYLRRYVSNSNGISLLYFLVHELNKINYPTKVLCFEPDNSLQPIPELYEKEIFYLNTTQVAIHNDDIVFYPETITSNPLHAKQVVRYLLNKPMFLTQEPIFYGETDYLLSYSYLIDNQLPQLFFMKDEQSLFSVLQANNKKGTVLYFGKIYEKHFKNENKFFKTIESTIPKPITIITRSYPSEHSCMLKQLASAELVVSFDGFTNTIYESTLLGTPVLVLDDPFCVKAEKYNVPRYGQFYDMTDFEKAKKEVALAYPEYVHYCSKQVDVIKEAIKSIQTHFFTIQTNKEYAIIVKNRNEKRIAYDKKVWNDNKRIITYNIDTINQLPLFYQKFDKQQYSSKVSVSIIQRTKRFVVRKCKMILRKIGLFHVIKNFYYSHKK